MEKLLRTPRFLWNNTLVISLILVKGIVLWRSYFTPYSCGMIQVGLKNGLFRNKRARNEAMINLFYVCRSGGSLEMFYNVKTASYLTIRLGSSNKVILERNDLEIGVVISLLISERYD